jgi:hypothetical protein
MENSVDCKKACYREKITVTSFDFLIHLNNGCFRKLCCYLPSSVEWLIAARDTRFPRGGR